MDEKKIKMNLRKKRIEKGYSQKHMAIRMDIDRNTYINLENGDTHMLSRRLYDAAEVLECSMESLLSEDDQGTRPYGGIRESSEDFVLLRDELNQARDKIAELEEKLKRLSDENEQLRAKNSSLEVMFSLQKEVADFSKEKVRKLEEEKADRQK